MLLDQPPTEFRQVIDVNLVGTWLVLRAVARAMIDANVGGSMVAISSISGTLADRHAGAYCISKAGVDMLVRVAAQEWGRYGIRVNAVGPGVTQTPLLGNATAVPGWEDGLTERTALGRLGEPEDIAPVVASLLELEWVTGQILHADGGLSQHSPIDTYGTALRARRSRA
jgi:NAD(P)-dependent dehydrogenase (short-subunit alcohol dehydrogenase family)